MKKTISQIAELVNGAVVGDDTFTLTGINGIREAQEGDLTFLGDDRYLRHLQTTKAAAVLVPHSITEANGKALIQVESPYIAFARVLGEIEKEQQNHPPGIHPTAYVAQSAQVGENVALGPNVVIDDDCQIGKGAILYAGVYIGKGSKVGENTLIYANVTLRERVSVGARCILHPGVVIGGDGFGFVPGNPVAKIPQIGTAIIEDDVEIGSNSCVDRATCGETTIGRGTKIDNLVQIGHNTRLGECCIVSGGVAIAGSATIGNNVIIGGMAGVGGHIEIGDDVMIAARSGVIRNVKAGEVVMGFPAIDVKLERRIIAGRRRLPDALKRIKKLEGRISQLEEGLHGKTENHR